MKSLSKRTLLIGLLYLFSAPLYGQNAYDALRYALEYPGQDAATVALPGYGVSAFTGLGSYADNPASLGFAEKSMFHVGVLTRNVSQDAQYSGFNNQASNRLTQLSDITIAYKFPTEQGNLVIGAGYNQTMDFDRVISVDAFNSGSTITDMFNESGFYGDAAFNSFAIDSVGGRTESVLRMGNYQGVDQRIEMTQTGRMGEVSVFGATEFQKNLYLGFSMGLITGRYNYTRLFREVDNLNLYDGFNGTYDFFDMLNNDDISATITGFRARAGLIYTVAEKLNIGASYNFPTRLNIDETYATDISTTFDNGDFFEDGFTGNNSYQVRIPSRFRLGASLNEIHGASISGSIELVDYGTGSLSNLGDTRYELEENDFIGNQFQNVMNYALSVSYQLNEQLQPRIGYAFQPSPRQDFDSSRRFYTAGIGIGLSEELMLDVGAQLTQWNDRTVLYDYFSPQNNSFISETANEQVRRLNVVVGLRYSF